MQTSREELQLILEYLPGNSLMLIAGELMSLQADLPEENEAREAISSFLTDILNTGEEKLKTDGYSTPFLDLVNHWYQARQASSLQEWYQRHLDRFR